jgi:hypothetical protein
MMMMMINLYFYTAVALGGSQGAVSTLNGTVHGSMRNLFYFVGH